MRPNALATALAALLAAACLVAAPAQALEEYDQYAVHSLSASLSDSQAGAHADLTVDFALTQKAGEPHGYTRDILVELPPGPIGNPQGIPRCTLPQLGISPGESECPVSAQVGISEVSLGGGNAGTFIEPIYNMQPPGGDVVARFGLFAGPFPILVNVRVDPVDYGLIAAIEGAPAAASLLGASSTFWGVPAASVHDAQRLTPEEALNGEAPAGGRKAGVPATPFMTNSSQCAAQRPFTVTATSYQLSEPKSKTGSFPQVSGCGLLAFEPKLSIVPTTSQAASPTGLDVSVEIPQSEAPNTLATSNLKSAEVTLPQGLSINPSAGAGLEACSAEQVGFEMPSAPACPEAAKLGSAEIEVPALERTLHGAVYQRTPEPGRLFGFWLVTDEQGVRLKLPAEIQADPLTGQLATVFDGVPEIGGLPQVPFSEFKLHFFGGPRAPLATPAACGTYSTHYSFSPWSGNRAAVGEVPMKIDGGCATGGFSPQILAGTTNSSAGSYAPFSFTLNRSDGEANPQALAVHLPQGLLARVGGVPLCPDSAALTGACPAVSRIGALATSAGVGGAPLWIPQPGKAPTAAYLAGPYKGSPYSIVSVVPAQAGPFDLGTVVNRAAIYIDPETALATVITDPLPQILEGVPVSYRTIHVSVDRPNFTLNPTSCDPKTISATVLADTGAVANPATGFQATDCAKLPYKPKLKLRFTGQTKRTGNPGVKAVLTQKPNQANTAAAVVLLPKSQFIDNAHISNPCTRVQFAAEACPKGSILGTAKARSPLLDQPLRGKVYFRSNGGDRELPDLVADLRGQIRIILVGFIDSVNGRVRTRFFGVPDAPVSRFDLKFFAGRRSLIANSKNLCRTNRRAKVRLAGQNGRRQLTSPVIGARCGKKHSKRKG